MAQWTNRARDGWFAVVLTPETAPWAFSKGEPFKAVAALELLATLLGLLFFAPPAPDDLSDHKKAWKTWWPPS